MEECAWCYDPIEADPYEVQGMTFHQECKDHLVAHPDCWPTCPQEVDECRPADQNGNHTIPA